MILYFFNKKNLYFLFKHNYSKIISPGLKKIFILLNYLQIHDERAAMEHYDDVYGMEGMSISKAGAALLGIDINALLADHKSSKDKLREIIETEIGLDEVSVLFNQIIETNYIKFDEVVECFQILVQKLR